MHGDAESSEMKRIPPRLVRRGGIHLPRTFVLLVLSYFRQFPPPDATIPPNCAAATTWSATARRSVCMRLLASVSYVRLASSTTQVPRSGSIQMEVPV